MKMLWQEARRTLTCISPKIHGSVLTTPGVHGDLIEHTDTVCSSSPSKGGVEVSGYHLKFPGLFPVIFQCEKWRRSNIFFIYNLIKIIFLFCGPSQSSVPGMPPMLWWIHGFEFNNANEFMVLISTKLMTPKPRFYLQTPWTLKSFQTTRLNTSVSQRQLKTSVLSTKLIISDDPQHSFLTHHLPHLH